MMATKSKRGRPRKPDSEKFIRAARALTIYNEARAQNLTDRQAKDRAIAEVEKELGESLSKSEIERLLADFQPADQSDAFLFEDAKPGELDAMGRRIIGHMKIGPRPTPPKRKRKPFRF